MSRHHDARVSRRTRWLTAGVAGLTGVAGLVAAGASSGTATAGTHSSPRLAAAWQVPPGDGGPGGSAGGEDPGWDGRDPSLQEGADRTGDQGRGWHGEDLDARRDPERGRDGEDGRAVKVPCDPDALIAAVTRADADGGGTLELAPRCTYVLTRSSGENGLPPITQRITVRGAKSVITRAAAAPNFRFFDVANGGHLTLVDLVLTGGQASAGGALRVQQGGTAEVERSTLVRNISTGNGGAVDNHGTTTAQRSVFARNTAAARGGGLHNEGLLEVDESRLVGNNGGTDGGAASNFEGTVLVRRSVVAGNRSGSDGGGLSIEGGRLVADRALLADNTTGIDGGALWIWRAQADLTRLSVRRNTGVNSGAVFILSNTPANASVVAIRDSSFENNTATGGIGYGGAIWNGRILSIANTDFTGNRAVLGGALYNAAEGTIALTRTLITRNTATVDGGGIENLGVVTTDARTTIVGNRPDNCAGNPVPNCFG